MVNGGIGGILVFESRVKAVMAEILEQCSLVLNGGGALKL